ncbi:hypothetical protein [Bradyrhizobium sp. CB3481]|uniref:hypothetical protein n=1 Tax=Bradyrhizobium sp. CB3481 TaxID=3039158 RepID=UPI0024B2706A|nr:hypothetical protein [Bradyrhizobium sp. CB3481]WFU14838.1 hypothetical protein QA643_27850 [Bradyrhizobium sp. CB3481]
MGDLDPVHAASVSNEALRLMSELNVPILHELHGLVRLCARSLGGTAQDSTPCDPTIAASTRGRWSRGILSVFLIDSAKISRPPGSQGDMALKPSAAPFSNQVWTLSAIFSGGLAITQWPRAPGVARADERSASRDQ